MPVFTLEMKSLDKEYNSLYGDIIFQGFKQVLLLGFFDSSRILRYLELLVNERINNRNL